MIISPYFICVNMNFIGWCPKYVDELFTNLDSAGLSQKEINTFMTLPFIVML
ncbi:hypothetical protein MTBBW1_1680051 [Desulfamplus magnetovallimortis]|uniref:Uncharacterized protein n=1 Tax=Desulfamplus magnetovallimortis TaxID=1246637 RepID=A0A1W1H9L9_9BACT|nr:hypothetical protein MTBBW1_1680051 [Desulfamplus magnetovallimortis]